MRARMRQLRVCRLQTLNISGSPRGNASCEQRHVALGVNNNNRMKCLVTWLSAVVSTLKRK